MAEEKGAEKIVKKMGDETSKGEVFEKKAVEKQEKKMDKKAEKKHGEEALARLMED